MKDFGRLRYCRSPHSIESIDNWLTIIHCHEWDGLFSIRAEAVDREVFLTAFCNNAEEGHFEIKEAGTVMAGKSRVSKAPELREPDCYTFPAGAYFGQGIWQLTCSADNGTILHVELDVLAWTATD